MSGPNPPTPKPTPAELKSKMNEALYAFADADPVCAFELGKLANDPEYRTSASIQRQLQKKGYVMTDGTINPEIKSECQSWVDNAGK